MFPLARFLCVVLLASVSAQRQCTVVWVGKANVTTIDPLNFKIYHFTPVDSVVTVPDLCYLKQHYEDQSDIWHAAAGKVEVCDANGPPEVTLEESEVHFPLRVKCRLLSCIAMKVSTVLYCEKKQFPEPDSSSTKT